MAGRPAISVDPLSPQPIMRRNRLRLSGLRAIIGSMSRAGLRDSSFENVQAVTAQKRPNNGLLPAGDVSADDVTGLLGGGP
jgi:hypothetical protein